MVRTLKVMTASLHLTTTKSHTRTTTSLADTSSATDAAMGRTPQSARRYPEPMLPAPGPAWYGSTMGTGIVVTLLTTHAHHIPGAGIAAVGILLLGWALIIGLTAAFAIYSLRHPRAFKQLLTNPAQSSAWGMVAMGFLAIGAATSTVAEARWPGHLVLASQIDLGMWIIGTCLGLATAVGFAAVLFRGRAGDPTPAWGLAIVPPMVSATTGATQVPHLTAASDRIVLLVVSVGCFFAALALGTAVFIVAYEHAWRRAPLPLHASAASWIPLGIVGQSTAAAQAMAQQSKTLAVPEVGPVLQAMANLYGEVVLAVGVPLFMWALVVTVRGLRGRMPFSPGWWATTFPVGTCCLGAHLLAVGTGAGWLDYVSVALLIFLLVNWTVCALASIGALVWSARQ